MSKRLSLLVAVCALAIGAPVSAGAAALHAPKKHGGGNAASSSSGTGGKQHKSCHTLPCH